MTEHRWSKFWWSDYENDDSLRLVSLAAQGLWMRILCAMHRAEPHGHLAINGKQPTTRQLAIMLCATEREIAKILPELEVAGVFSRTPDGMIYSRRLVRDKAIRDEAIVNGKRGGNPILKGNGNGEGLTPPVGLTLKLEAEAEADTEADNLPPVCPPSAAPRAAAPTPKATGCRLPDGWVPNDDDRRFAGMLGLDADAVGERFRDYWTAQPGAKGRKSDWPATWRNWCRRDAEQPKPKLHTLPLEQQNRRILAAAGLGFVDPPPIVEPIRRIAQ